MLLKNSYTSLPSKFYEFQNPEASDNPECVLYNSDLAKELWVGELFPAENAHNLLGGNVLPAWAHPIAQAYMGHQFGYPNMLWDGRALLLGEYEDSKWNLVDIVLKWSGVTPFSRWGDGKATLRAMLREYIMSEAMRSLWIPSSRSLAVIKTGNSVVRNTLEDWAILTRVMKSHLRVWTFEFAKAYGTKDDMQALIDYTIKRYYPELVKDKNPALSFLKKVADMQMDLVIDWLRVWFIHGVMNTDNTSITGETFDYGPCAFIWSFKSQQVFSSIDEAGRYSFGNQANIILWNLSVFASTLSDFIDEKDITETLKTLPENMHGKWLIMMCKKIWISQPISTDEGLARELLSWMESVWADYTQTFLYISWYECVEDIKIYNDSRFQNWYKVWQQRVPNIDTAQKLMQKQNPTYIPRNHLVEASLERALQWDYSQLHDLIQILKNPYTFQKNSQKYMEANVQFDTHYTTYCGT